MLVFTKNTALVEHGVHEGGFAVVDMGDDGDVANRLSYTRIHMRSSIRLFAQGAARSRESTDPAPQSEQRMSSSTFSPYFG